MDKEEKQWGLRGGWGGVFMSSRGGSFSCIWTMLSYDFKMREFPAFGPSLGLSADCDSPMLLRKRNPPSLTIHSHPLRWLVLALLVSKGSLRGGLDLLSSYVSGEEVEQNCDLDHFPKGNTSSWKRGPHNNWNRHMPKNLLWSFWLGDDFLEPSYEPQLGNKWSIKTKIA
jgi:hypothetical protein